MVNTVLQLDFERGLGAVRAEIERVQKHWSLHRLAKPLVRRVALGARWYGLPYTARLIAGS